MAWLTPDSAPVGYSAFLLFLPVDAGGEVIVEFGAILSGALLDLVNSRNFEDYGSLTPEETAEVFGIVYALSHPWIADP